MIRLGVIALVLCLAVAACSEDDRSGSLTDGAETEGSTGASEPSPDSADTQAEGTPGDPTRASLALEEVAVLDQPIAMTIRAGDDSLFVAERPGRVRAISPDGAVGEPIIDISASTATNGERGLLGLAWAADGETLYLSSSDSDGSTRLESFDMVDAALDPDSRREILTVDQPAANHNGGDIHLGPDGFLWLGLGDGGAADDQFGNGQRPDTLLGTMLRIDPTQGDPYAIPAGNPFDGSDGAREVYAYGLRNPWRFSFDAATEELWIADVGQNAVEEINRVPADQAGLNYGWPRFEGDRPFDGQSADGPVVDPVHTYDHTRGCSITGGYVYRGAAIPDLTGAYLYTDFCNSQIYALPQSPDGTPGDDVDTGLSVVSAVSFGQGPDLELYVLSLDGPVYKIIQG